MCVLLEIGQQLSLCVLMQNHYFIFLNALFDLESILMMPLNEKVKFKTCEVDPVWFNADNFFYYLPVQSFYQSIRFCSVLKKNKKIRGDDGLLGTIFFFFFK